MICDVRFKGGTQLKSMPERARFRTKSLRVRAPLIKGRLILLLVHGIIDVLIVVPPSRSSGGRLRLVQDARDILHALRQVSAESAAAPNPFSHHPAEAAGLPPSAIQDVDVAVWRIGIRIALLGPSEHWAGGARRGARGRVHGLAHNPRDGLLGLRGAPTARFSLLSSHPPFPAGQGPSPLLQDDLGPRTHGVHAAS